MMHCKIVCHRTTRTLLPLSRRSPHQRAALRRHRSWLFAAYMLHVEDPRASGHAERAEPPPDLETMHVEEVFDAPQHPEGRRADPAGARRRLAAAAVHARRPCRRHAEDGRVGPLGSGRWQRARADLPGMAAKEKVELSFDLITSNGGKESLTL